MKTLAAENMFCYIDDVSGKTGLCGDATRAPGHQEGFGRHLRRRYPEEGFTAFLQKRKIPGVPGGRAPWASLKMTRDWHGVSLLMTTGGCPVHAEPTQDHVSSIVLNSGKRFVWIGGEYKKLKWQWLDGTTVDSSLWTKNNKPTDSSKPVLFLDTSEGIKADKGTVTGWYVIEWDE